MIDFNPCIIFHWGNVIVGSEIWKTKLSPWINKFKQTKVYITYHKNKYNQIKIYLNPTYIKILDDTIIFDDLIFLFEVPNIGMDIGPFLHVIRYIINNNIPDDIKLITIIKIHTKSDKVWRDSIISQLLDININETLFKKWNSDNVGIYIPTKFKYKLDRLNTSTTHELLNIMNIDFDLNKALDNSDSFNKKITITKKIDQVKSHTFDYEFYQTYNNINCYYDNERDIKIFLDYHWKNIGKYKNLLYNKIQLSNTDDYTILPSIQETYEICEVPIVCNIYKYYFSAGTMFWIKGDIIYKFFSKFDFEKHIGLLEPGYTLNDKPTYVHAWERIISLIPTFYNKIDINDL